MPGFAKDAGLLGSLGFVAAAFVEEVLWTQIAAPDRMKANDNRRPSPRRLSKKEGYLRYRYLRLIYIVVKPSKIITIANAQRKVLKMVVIGLRQHPTRS